MYLARDIPPICNVLRPRLSGDTFILQSREKHLDDNEKLRLVGPWIYDKVVGGSFTF